MSFDSEDRESRPGRADGRDASGDSWVAEGSNSTTPPPSDAEASASDWLKEVLGRVPEGFYHIGYSAARSHEWRDEAGLRDTKFLDDFRLVSEGLRQQRRRDEGLVVLVTDDREDARARAYSAYQVARLLGESGARVLMVDADLHAEGLSEVLGPNEREGVIDVIRYGASPRACAEPVGLNGVDFIGVGSFRPEAGEGFDDERLAAAFKQLRATADFVLVVAPVRGPDDRFHSFLVHADGALLGVRLHAGDRARFEDTVGYLQGQAIPVFGVMAYTSAEESVELTVETFLDEDVARASSSSSPYAGSHSSRGDESSSLFRFITVAMAIVLLGFVGWWAVVQWRGRPQLADDLELAAIEAARSDESAEALNADPPVIGAATQLSSADDSADEQDPALSAAGTESGNAPATDAIETNPIATDGGTPGDASEAAAGAPPRGAAIDRAAEGGVAESQPVLPDPAPVTQAGERPARNASPVVDDSAPDDEMADSQLFNDRLRLEPIDGYALHVWSFPDSALAISSLRKLEGDGFHPVIHRSEIDGKGTWYRVLVGEYPTRAEAFEARALLSRRQDVDYVGVVRVRP